MARASNEINRTEWLKWASGNIDRFMYLLPPGHLVFLLKAAEDAPESRSVNFILI
jgi:hypothetical protein